MIEIYILRFKYFDTKFRITKTSIGYQKNVHPMMLNGFSSLATPVASSYLLPNGSTEDHNPMISHAYESSNDNDLTIVTKISDLNDGLEKKVIKVYKALQYRKRDCLNYIV